MPDIEEHSSLGCELSASFNQNAKEKAEDIIFHALTHGHDFSAVRTAMLNISAKALTKCPVKEREAQIIALVKSTDEYAAVRKERERKIQQLTVFAREALEDLAEACSRLSEEVAKEAQSGEEDGGTPREKPVHRHPEVATQAGGPSRYTTD